MPVLTTAGQDKSLTVISVADLRLTGERENEIRHVNSTVGSAVHTDHGPPLESS